MEEGGGREEFQKEMWYWKQGQRGAMLVALKMEEEGYKGRNAHGRWQVENARTQILPHSFRKGVQPY